MAKRKKFASAARILSLKIRFHADTDPDLSYLGEYSSSPGDDGKTVDRKERGDMGRNELRYWIATNGADETGNPQSVEEDYARCEAYNRGSWGMVGIRAEALVTLNGELTQRITSGGLWGIESDSDDEYMESVGAEELENLEAQLVLVGFPAATVALATHDMSTAPTW